MYIPTGAVVIGASVFVLILDIGHPAELRAFVFYAEVCVHVYECRPVCVCMCVHLCCFLSASNSLYMIMD